MNEGCRIVITGASGLIGSALCEYLTGKGVQVTALTRSPAAFRASHPGVTAVRWGPGHPEDWIDAVDGAYAVVHLAGENLAAGRWTAAKKKRLFQSRVASGTSLVHAVQKVSHKPRVFVQASAVGYYAPPTRLAALPESAPAGSGFLPQLVQQWEASTTPVEAVGVRRVVIRSAVVLSPTGGMLPRLLRPFRWGLGGHPGSGRQPFPWISLEDEVGAIAFLVEKDSASGAYNLAAPERVTMRDFCTTLGRVIGKPCWLPVPAPVLQLLFGEMAEELLLTGTWASPQRLMELGYTFRHPELAAALEQLLGKGGPRAASQEA